MAPEKPEGWVHTSSVSSKKGKVMQKGSFSRMDIPHTATHKSWAVNVGAHVIEHCLCPLICTIVNLLPIISYVWIKVLYVVLSWSCGWKSQKSNVQWLVEKAFGRHYRFTVASVWFTETGDILSQWLMFWWACAHSSLSYFWHLLQSIQYKTVPFTHFQ